MNWKFWQNPTRGQPPRPVPPSLGRLARARGGIAAGDLTRISASFTGTHGSFDQDIYTKLALIRARSRDLAYNNDYARKFLQMCGTHIIGPTGFTLQSKPLKDDGTIDRLDAASIENGWYAWGKRGICDVSKRLSWCDLEHQLTRAIARDGDAILRMIPGASNGYGFGVQLLDIDRLDINKNEQLAGERFIKMGVECEKWGEPIAYHLRKRHPGDSFYANFSYYDFERVTASEIVHLYLPERPEQTRGLPWMVSAMLRLQHLGKYDEAAVVAARVGAAKMGWWESPDGNGDALADDKESDGTLISEAEPGTIGVGPAGYKWNSFMPEYPHAQYQMFTRACLRGVASGLGVAYNTLGNDLEGVNYSSIRQGVLEERDNWMVLQRWLSESLHDRIFPQWLRFSLLSGALKTKSGKPLPLSRFDKFNSATWQGRRWSWVDPEKDIEAGRKAISAGLKSRTMIAAEQGIDLEDVFEDLGRENELATKHGIKIEIDPLPPPRGAPPSEEPTRTITQTIETRTEPPVVLRVEGLEAVNKALEGQANVVRDIATMLKSAEGATARLVENDTNIARAIATVGDEARRSTTVLKDGLARIATEAGKPRKAVLDAQGNPIGNIAVDKLEQ